MIFYRRPVFFFALVAVVALAVPYTAADEVQSNLDKIGDDLKKTLEGFQTQVKDVYEKLSPETKANLATATKTIQDAAKTIQEKTAEALKDAKLDDHVKAFQAKAGELYESAKSGLEKKD